LLEGVGGDPHLHFHAWIRLLELVGDAALDLDDDLVASSQVTQGHLLPARRADRRWEWRRARNG
jgi:hypothetical protein